MKLSVEIRYKLVMTCYFFFALNFSLAFFSSSFILILHLTLCQCIQNNDSNEKIDFPRRCLSLNEVCVRFTFESGDLASLITIFNLFVCDRNETVFFRFVIETFTALCLSDSLCQHAQIDNVCFALIFYFTVQFDRHVAVECECDAPVLEFTRKGKPKCSIFICDFDLSSINFVLFFFFV